MYLKVYPKRVPADGHHEAQAARAAGDTVTLDEPDMRPSQELHLTPRGWVSGTSKDQGEVRGKVVDRPADAIETWMEEMVIAYPQCADVYAWTLIWFDPSVSVAERREVRQRFPKPSEDFPD